MKTLVPNRFLFDFEFPLRYRAKLPKIDGDLSDWSDAERLPALGAIDGRPEFALVWACWNERGLCIAAEVKNKRKLLRCDPASFWTGDNLRLCTDMRDVRDAKRASRFCQQFWFLPTGGGSNRSQALGGVNKFQRAREDAPKSVTQNIQVASKLSTGGYRLEAHVPSECLSGFDPIEHPRIGFYYILEDGDHGEQFLTIGDDLNWYVDPSTWATAVLSR